jgi:hypothetical protein
VRRRRSRPVDDQGAEPLEAATITAIQEARGRPLPDLDRWRHGIAHAATEFVKSGWMVI